MADRKTGETKTLNPKKLRWHTRCKVKGGQPGDPSQLFLDFSRGSAQLLATCETRDARVPGELATAIYWQENHTVVLECAEIG